LLQLPLQYRQLVEAETYPVRCSRGLQELLRQARRRSADAEAITPV
jgi:hypothetical protein